MIGQRCAGRRSEGGREGDKRAYKCTTCKREKGRARSRARSTDFLVPPLRSPSAFGDNAVTRFADGDECPSCLPPLSLSSPRSYFLPPSWSFQFVGSVDIDPRSPRRAASIISL